MVDDDQEIDALVNALKASGWDRQTTTTALAEADRAAAERLLGATNARRLATTPRGARVRMVRTSEVYSVRNSRGWLIGAIEGKHNRPLYDGLTDAERTKVLNFARERGFRVVEYSNPTPPRPAESEPVPRSMNHPEIPDGWGSTPQPKRKPATPSARVKPSRRHLMIEQLGKFRA